ncbi:MAG: DUF4097 domain-containing protein [Gemmatimonadetes bacterium]|nr:DUF4097 domain-containing protein [Gemmatimonadota bacterium]NNK49707.1 DUF4097 family beta strand repeat protein [Gemmatimonadota bacterium]
MLKVNSVLMRVSALVFAAALAACGDDDDPTGPGPGDADFEWSGDVAQALAIEIKGISGSITASLAAGDQVEVFALKEGDQDDPSTVTIEVLQHAGGVTICSMYPDAAGQPPNVCAPGLDGQLSNNENDVEVTFSVRVPAGVDFVGRTVAGNVTASGLESDAFAYIVAGSADISTTTIAAAQTVSGNIDVTIGESDPDRDLVFSTVSGDVAVRVPADTNAGVRATFVTGTVSSDFPLTETSPGVWEATLGSGGNLLSLSTVTGSVALRSGG